MMKAAYYEKTGPADEVLQVGDLADPQPGSGEVLVKIAVSAVHPSDVKTRGGARGPLAYPMVIPHSDGAGRIVAVGDGVDAGRVGERVWIWNAGWKRAFGTAAELVALPSDQAVIMPDNVSYSRGATLGIPAVTAHRCLFADGPIDGMTILVTGGAGTVAGAAIQMANRSGARVIATVSGDQKAEHARRLGADATVNYRDAEAIANILAANGGHGVDRIIEVEFGGNLAITQAVLAEGGTIVAYGSMAVPEPVLPFYPMMFANQTLRGVLAYTIPDHARQQAEADIHKWLADGSLAPPIAGEIPLAEVVASHEAVEIGNRIGVSLLRIADDTAV
ncbi:MAG: NADPH:quinone reductase [Boseongicola sp.]